jgi:adenylate cyclase
MQKKIGYSVLVPLAAAALFTALHFLDFYRVIENRVYDALLHVKPAVAEDSSILLLDVDDTAIANVGVWPWSRDIMAEGLVTMKEFGASYAVFDIEYTEQSPRGIDSELIENDIPKALAGEFGTINRNVRELFAAVKNRSISFKDAEDYLKDLERLTDQSRDALMGDIRAIVKDNDVLLGRSARFFGNAYFTINMLPSGKEEIPEELRKHAAEVLPLRKVVGDTEIPYKVADIRPAIYPVLGPAAGAGFPNVEVDSDGVRRRLFLVLEYQDKRYPQLAFSALLKKMGDPQITLEKNRIVLDGAELPGKGKARVSIPLTEDGTVLINWPKKSYQDSFRHLSYWYLELHRRQEDALTKGLALMERDQYLSYYEDDPDLVARYREALKLREELMDSPDEAKLEDYRALREEFFAAVGDFLSGPTEASIVSSIDEALAAGNLSAAERDDYARIKEEVSANFANLKNLYGEFAKTRDTLRKNLPGSFCIIGNAATSTTDMGVNPFVKRYENVGTHASLVNTVLQAAFLDDFPWWGASLVTLLLALAVYFVLRDADPLPSLIIGAAVVVLVMVAGTLVFVATGVYVNLVTPTLAVFFTFIILASVKFIKTAKEKSYIRNAFGHYLSADVINELITNPDKLKLGGEKKFMTAMFTDIKGFSTVSEQMDPTDLVKLLNVYLTEMSDVVMDLRGTIDKYEGDAIISFFGAPMEYPDHAEKALAAAIRMKKVEDELNARFLQDKLSPGPLYTRFGINTGDMVVGNMGTARKMDYTIMGNAVNLAARLEGVNKQYGTWILTSEYTQAAGGDSFLYRMLDRVRVVGINTPIRLYQVVDNKGDASPQQREAVDLFHSGIEYFEGRDWDRARKSFTQVQKILPDDGPSLSFLKRIDAYVQTPPPDNWDGVFNLTTK